jgi:hypothetical protein
VQGFSHCLPPMSLIGINTHDGTTVEPIITSHLR